LFVVIVSYSECELCILLTLICSPGNSKETPLADIVAHLTAKRDDDVCFHVVDINWNYCSYRKTSNKRPRRIFEHGPQNPGV